MSPIKLVVIAIILYIGYRLLTGGKKKNKAHRPAAPLEEDSPPVVDILVEDPVCHKLVPKKQAIRLQHKENIVYFCSEACCNRFVSKEGEKE
ncbi:MAG: hypothetical protein KJ804_19970 [Proteobacteria bacterium]|nr:hypothetical protein [Pseudomonadota bacterium]MBU1060586.1 hypothetical protein [Pseudomonadota bacterium]